MQAPQLRPFGTTPDDAERGNSAFSRALRRVPQDFGARVTFAMKIDG
jgi:hypothetical protein